MMMIKMTFGVRRWSMLMLIKGNTHLIPLPLHVKRRIPRQVSHHHHHHHHHHHGQPRPSLRGPSFPRRKLWPEWIKQKKRGLKKVDKEEFLT